MNRPQVVNTVHIFALEVGATWAPIVFFRGILLFYYDVNFRLKTKII